MANEQNLVPFTSEQNREEAAKNGHNGGIASGAARRRKRDMREAADLLLSLKATPKMMADMAKLGVSADEADMQMAMLVAQLQQAIKGNTKAAALLYNMASENRAEKTTVTRADMDDVTAYIRGNAHAYTK